MPNDKKKLFEIPEDVDAEAPAVEEVQVDDSLPVTAPVVAEVDTAAEAKEEPAPKEGLESLLRGNVQAKREKIRIKTEEERKADLAALKAKREEERIARLLRQRNLDITQFDGISVGGRATVDARKSRRLTRDRRRESIERRKDMSISVGGEEKELSEASKYMLDMLVKD